MDRPERTHRRASPMLSIGRLGASGGADYYLDKVANNVDDYYLGRGEAPGTVDRGGGRSSSGWSARSKPRPCGTCWPGTRRTVRRWASRSSRAAGPATT